MKLAILFVSVLCVLILVGSGCNIAKQEVEKNFAKERVPTCLDSDANEANPENVPGYLLDNTESAGIIVYRDQCEDENTLYEYHCQGDVWRTEVVRCNCVEEDIAGMIKEADVEVGTLAKCA